MAAGQVFGVCRILFALVIGVLVGFAGLPDAARALTSSVHTSDNDLLKGTHKHNLSAPDNATDLVTDFGHCHPGLDCFTAATFFLELGLQSPSAASEVILWVHMRTWDLWKPGLEYPPPRYIS